MKKSKLTLIIDGILVIVSFIMLTTAILAMKYIINSKNMFLEIFLNLNSNPVEDIQAFRWRCPADYFPIFNLTLPGITKGGCSIDGVEMENPDKCSNEELGGISWKKMDSINLHIWQNSTLCLKKYSFQNISKIFVNENTTCPQAYIDCGYSNVYKNKLCLKPLNNTGSINCPINFLKVVEFSELAVNDYALSKKIPLTNQTVLVFSKNVNATSFIPVDFQVSENVPCIIPDRISNISEFFPYANLTDFKYGCDPNNPNVPIINSTYLDHRYLPVDSTEESEFYFNNDIQILPKIQNWNKNENKLYNLYYRTFISINVDCLITGKVDNINDSLNQIKYYQFMLIIFYLLNLLLLCFFISLINLMKIGSKVQNIILSLVKLLLSIGFVCISMYFAFKAYNLTSQTEETLKYITSQEYCIDPTTLFHYKHIFEENIYLEYLLQFNVINLILTFPYVILLTIQIGKFVHKTYLRLSHRAKTGRTSTLLKELINITPTHKNSNTNEKHSPKK